MFNSLSVPYEEYHELKDKASKWDKLHEEVSKFYLNDKGEELEENEFTGDLGSIGEIAASHLGYL